MSILFSISLSGLIILFASIIRGTTGFGLALVALPLLVNFLPVKEVVVLLAIVNFLFSVIHIVRERGMARIRYIVFTGIFSMAGVFIGFILLRSIPDKWISVVAGLAIIMAVIAMISGFSIKVRNISLSYSIASFIGGILAGSITIGGPFVALVLTGTNTEKEKFRSAMSYFFLFSYGFAIVLYTLDSMVDKETLIHASASLPFLIAGLLIGERVSKKVDQRLFKLFIFSLLLIMGFLMIYRNLK